MTRLAKYFARLNTPRIILWCYAIWYCVNVYKHFEWRPRLWFTSLGLSGIIGIGLYLSTLTSSKGKTDLDRWQIFRLFLMPFCVSSFSALVKDDGYFLIFPPTACENFVAFLLIAAFVLGVALLRRLPVFGKRTTTNEH